MPMGQCCATGSLHTGTPTGRIEKLHGLDCYIADPPSGSAKGIVIIIPDALGWTFANNRILADDIAKNGGFQVYLPEFMDGIVLPEDILISIKAVSKTGLWDQLYKLGHFLYLMRFMLPFLYFTRASVVFPRIVNFLKALKTNEAKDLPIGTAGYCWGGQHVIHLCKGEEKADNGKPLVVCGFAAHASFVKYPDEIEAVQLPYSYAAAERDPMLSLEAGKQVKEILTAKTAKSKDSGVEHEFVFYDDTDHGFAVRADEDEKHAAAQGKKAEAQAVAWFAKWFTNYARVATS